MKRLKIISIIWGIFLLCCLGLIFINGYFVFLFIALVAITEYFVYNINKLMCSYKLTVKGSLNGMYYNKVQMFIEKYILKDVKEDLLNVKRHKKP